MTLTTVTVSEKGQIAIPQAIRESIGLIKGGSVLFMLYFHKVVGRLLLNNFYRIILFSLLAVFSLVNIAGVSAQTVTVLGELQSTGKVFIGSSNGKWTPAMPTYPLLENTALRTEDGSASIVFKDGSRVDLSRDTIATVSGSSADYTVTLAQGVIAFNMGPSSSLSVTTPAARITVNSKSDLVQKVGYTKAGRVLGVISATEKGTEVRNISGKILVNDSASGTRTLTSGESILIGQDNTYKVYKTQSVTGGGANGRFNVGQAIVLGAFGAGAITAYSSAETGSSHTFVSNIRP